MREKSFKLREPFPGHQPLNLMEAIRLDEEPVLKTGGG